MTIMFRNEGGTTNEDNLKNKDNIKYESNLNKAFVGLGSCDNVRTERKIFEYAN